MGSTTTRWSRRPEPERPPLVASAGARRTWPEVDAALARGAVEYALTRLRASLRRHGIAAALLIDPVNVRYVRDLDHAGLDDARDRPVPPGVGRG